MEKFKNIIYDKSDLLVAVLIVGIAGLVIWFGISNIMQPYTGNAETTANAADTELAGSAAVGEEGVTTEVKEDKAKDTEGTTEATTITIKEGENTDKIAEKLMIAGVLESKTVFYKKLEDMGVASRLQPGTYDIPIGSSLEDVIRIITKTN